MTEPWKGGKGKKAPYETTHQRIPQPIHRAVQMFSDRYKQLIAGGVTDTTGEKLIRRVEDAIYVDAFIPGTKNEGEVMLGTRYNEDSDKSNEELEKLREENTHLRSQLDDQVKLAEEWCEKAKVLELESQPGVVDPEAIAILKEALELKANAGGAIKNEIKKALKLLNSMDSNKP